MTAKYEAAFERVTEPWLDAGWDEGAAARWCLTCWTPEEGTRWRAAGYTAEDVELIHGHWTGANRDRHWMNEWVHTGWRADRIALAIVAGLEPTCSLDPTLAGLSDETLAGLAERRSGESVVRRGDGDRTIRVRRWTLMSGFVD